MLRSFVLLVCLVTTVLLAGCLVRHHGYGPPAGRPCQTSCAQWGYQDVCDQRCRVWGNGVCMAWERRCSPRRTCLRQGTRCY
jgi:hypothetical protein